MATLYNTADGATLGLVDPGEGVRQKSWIDEIPSMLLEASNSPLGTASTVPLSNYPEFLTGVGNSTEFSVDLFSASPRRIPNSAGAGDGTTTAWTVGTFGGPILRGSSQVVGRTTGIIYGTDAAATTATGTYTATAGEAIGTLAGTVTYATGAVTAMTFTGNPETLEGTDGIDFTAKRLIAITLSDPVRLSPNSTVDYALTILP